MSTVNIGTLYVVSTPIGNLEDINSRALHILRDVDYVLCEDTRVTKKILRKYSITSNLISLNEKNEIKKIPKIVADLDNDKRIALVSDAGTPCISDPGFRLISHIKESNYLFNIIPIPGATASIAALSVSGLPSDSFYFTGFLPKKKGRNKKLKEISKFDCSIILYESPYRVNRTLSDLLLYLGNRKIFIAREMTKLFEEYHYGDLLTFVENKNEKKLKGEFVIIIAKKGYKCE